MAKTHHCVLLGHQIGSTSNIVLGEEGVRNSEKPTDVIYGLATLFCCHYFIVDVTIKGNNSRVSNIESDNYQNVGLEDYNNISFHILLPPL